MSSGKEISGDLRKLVIKQRNEEKSYGEIAKLLNLSRSTVQTIIKNYKMNGSIENKPRSGRPKKLSQRDVSSILREVNKNPIISGPNLAEHISKTSGKVVSPRTITRVLNDNSIKSRTPRKKPLISLKNRRLRLEFAKANVNKDISFWNRVLFTDESKFNIFGSDGRMKVWRKPNTALDQKNIVPTVKHGGGNVMVWGAIAASGVGKLAFIPCTMDRFVYKNILEQHLKSSVETLSLGNSWIFQQDKDPKHTAHIVKE